MSPAQCDMQYLEAARKLTMFGVDAHPATVSNDPILFSLVIIGFSSRTLVVLNKNKTASATVIKAAAIT